MIAIRSFSYASLFVVLAATQMTSEPASRSCVAATALPSAGVLVWGGARACGVNVVDDSAVWQWSGRQWTVHSKLSTSPREDALLVADDRRLWLFGGRRDGAAFSDVWVRDGDAWRTVNASGGPGAIQHGAAAVDRKRNRVVVFGGAVGRSMDPRTFEWDGTRWHAFDVPGPGARIGHAMAWSDADGGVLLYGGFAERGQFTDLWRWDGSRWSELSKEGPTHTEGAMVSEAAHGIYITGTGINASASAPVKSWQWLNGRFIERATSGRASRVGATTVFDRRRGTLVLFGGAEESGRPDPSIWEFDGATWRAVSHR